MANTVRFKASVDDQVSGKLARIRDNFDRLGKSKGFMSVAQGVGMGVGISAWNMVGDAVRGAADFMGDSIEVASSLAESMSKANVVFGRSASVIDEFAATSADAFGISKRAAYEATGTFGNLFTTMGLGQDAAASMSVKVTSLAADLASFNNIGIDVALEKLQSGLVGEAKPLRDMGILLDEATVKAKAMEMGLGDATGELSQAAKVQARYALILEQSTSAQGDFERTSDGLANSQRVLAAMLEDVQAQIGQELIPVMLTLARVAKEDVVPAISDMVGAYGHLQWAMAEQRRKTDDLMFWQRGLLGLWTDSQFSAEAYAAALDATKVAAEAGAEGYATLNRQLGDTDSSYAELNAMLRDTGPAARRAASGADALAGSLDDNATAAKDAAKELADLEKRADSLWDALIEGTRTATRDEKLELQKLPIQIREAQRDVATAQRELEKARTKEQKDEAKIRLIEAKQDVVRLQEDLEALRTRFARTGKAIGYSLGSSLRAEARRWVNLTISEVRRLDGISYSGPGSNSAGPQPRAVGGPVWEGRTYLVGERGPELFVPSTSGTIVPNGGAASGVGGAPVVLQVNLDGRVITEVVDRNLAYLRRTAPGASPGLR